MIDNIIDAHCHVYPDPIALKATEAVEDFYPTLPRDHHDGTCSTLIRSGNECGITRFVIHSVATIPKQVHSINTFIAAAVEQSGGAFIGLGAMHPDVEDKEAAVEEIRALGLRGIKMHPDIQRFPADDERIMPVYEMCEALGLPVLVHTGDHRYDFSNPQRIARILRAFPKLRFIGAHFGGWSVWDEAASVLADFPNIWVDTCSSLHFLGAERGRKLIDVWGADRVMFATDYPLWKQRPEIDAILNMGLSDDELRKIFRDNCAAFYGIDASKAPGE